MRKQVSFAFALSLLAVPLAMPSGIHAEEDHRELGAHVHGHGTLNIAVEDKRVLMELEAPGMDIVGFEHAAKSDDQKARVDAANAILQRPLDIFALPGAAGCTVVSAEVKVEAEHHDDGDDHDHDAKDKAGDAHDHDHGDDHDAHEHEGHNQFHATYELACTNPAELASIGFDYFKHFAGAQGLTVNVVAAKGQSKYEVRRDKPTLDLGGIM